MPRSTTLPEPRLSHRGDEPHLLREIMRAHQALMAGFARGFGMPAARFVLMRLVATAERDVGVMALARQLGINASAVTRQLKDMEGEGLVRRRADPGDGRRSYVTLTPKGRKLFEEIHGRSHELEGALAATLDAREVAAAVKVLAELRAFLERQHEHGKGAEHG